MRILLDTNIIIDAYLALRPCHEYANILLEECEFAKVDICVCALSLKDTYYVLCKIKPENEVRKAISNLFELTTILGVDDEILKNAISSNEPDFEDGIIRACAENNKIDFIITRDKAAYQNSWVSSMDSKAFCEHVLRGKSSKKKQLI